MREKLVELLTQALDTAKNCKADGCDCDDCISCIENALRAVEGKEKEKCCKGQADCGASA